MLEAAEQHNPEKIRQKYQWFSFIHKKILDPISSKSMWYKDNCQLDAQMNAKIKQSKRHRYINIHPIQRQNIHAQYLKSTSQTTIIPIF
jgi:hypothetical protein